MLLPAIGLAAAAKKKKGKGGKVDNTDSPDILFAPLLPFKPLMKKLLKDKGYHDTGDLSETAVLFHKVFISKKFEGKDYFFSFETDFDLKTEIKNFIDPATATGIISAILGFIRNIREKKKKGETLSPGEQKIYDATESYSSQIEKTIQSQARETATKGIGETVLKFLPLIAGGLILFLLFRK